MPFEASPISARTAMPIYEYRCAACGHELEALQKFSEPPLTSCPTCHKDELVKLVSAAGFQLKGSGWYATDFKGGGKPAVRKTGETKTDTKSEPKADAKAETKADSKTSAAPSGPASSSGADSASS
jgi:putative FmdB family regulatory protein